MGVGFILGTEGKGRWDEILKRFEVHEAVGSADGVHMPVEEDDVANLFSMDGAAGNACVPPRWVDGASTSWSTSSFGDFIKHVAQIGHRLHTSRDW